MSDRQTEQERDAAVIDPAAMIREMASMMIVYPHYHDTYNRAIRTIDRLTAERDAARRDLNAIFELTITDVMASYDPEQIVHHVSILRKERDAALAKLESEGRE